MSERFSERYLPANPLAPLLLRIGVGVILATGACHKEQAPERPATSFRIDPSTGDLLENGENFSEVIRQLKRKIDDQTRKKFSPPPSQSDQESPRGEPGPLDLSDLISRLNRLIILERIAGEKLELPRSIRDAYHPDHGNVTLLLRMLKEDYDSLLAKKDTPDPKGERAQRMEKLRKELQKLFEAANEIRLERGDHPEGISTEIRLFKDQPGYEFMDLSIG